MKDNIILCVEDNKQVQEFNKQLLEAKGFTVRLAACLAEARAEMERQMPRQIILDIHLPDDNGLDFLRQLRKSSNIPVIALTDDNEEGDIVMGLASGCDDYVPKPYTFSVLYARVEALLRRQQPHAFPIVWGEYNISDTFTFCVIICYNIINTSIFAFYFIKGIEK